MDGGEKRWVEIMRKRGRRAARRGAKLEEKEGENAAGGIEGKMVNEPSEEEGERRRGEVTHTHQFSQSVKRGSSPIKQWCYVHVCADEMASRSS